MISHKHKLIFIHIPKCAGTSIERCLFNNHQPAQTNYKNCHGWDEKNKIWMQHATAEQIKELYVDDFYSFTRFAVVRNPWDRAVSDYIWIKRELKICGSLKDYLLLEGKFNDNRLKLPQTNKSTRADHIRPQSDFIFSQRGENLVEHICKFENLQQEFDDVLLKNHLPKLKLPHANKTNHKHYTEYYNNETIEIVERKFSKDIKNFNYKFQ
jgi:hypothetical protein